MLWGDWGASHSTAFATGEDMDARFENMSLWQSLDHRTSSALPVDSLQVDTQAHAGGGWVGEVQMPPRSRVVCFNVPRICLALISFTPSRLLGSGRNMAILRPHHCEFEAPKLSSLTCSPSFDDRMIDVAVVHIQRLQQPAQQAITAAKVGQFGVDGGSASGDDREVPWSQ